MPAGTPLQMRLHDEDCDALDEYRRQLRNPPTRAAAARDLFRRALREVTGDHGRDTPHGCERSSGA
jgi:hypothetical protein